MRIGENPFRIDETSGTRQTQSQNKGSFGYNPEGNPKQYSKQNGSKGHAPGDITSALGEGFEGWA